MKTILKYYEKESNIESSCGEILEIAESSRELNWEGIILEKGVSQYFHPKNVVTPNFYFAVELENDYIIEVKEEEKTILKKNEIGYIWVNPPNTPFTHDINEKCSFIIIAIEEVKMFNSFVGSIPENLLFLNNYSVEDEVLVKLIELLYIEVKSNGRNGSWYVDNVISLISNYFIRNYSNYNDLKRSNKEVSLLNSENINKVTEYIRKNIKDTINIDMLAKAFNVSKFYFLREFKNLMGITPYQYIIKMKIEYAKELIKEGNDTITEIALLLGFNDSSHFTRTFKGHEGITPKEFRKNFLQKRKQ